MKKQLVNGFVTHLYPHLDEELALLLLADYGGNIYEFGRDCRVRYASGYLAHDDFTVYGRKTLRLGIGGGIYDDHGRKDGKACCQLVAEHLRIADKPELIKLVSLVAYLDKEKAKNRGQGMTLPRLIKMAYRYGKTPEQVRAWVRCALDALIAKEKEFFEEIRRSNEHIRDQEARRKLNRLQFLAGKRPWETLVVDTIAPFLPKEDRGDWLAFSREVQELQQAAFAKAAKYARENMQKFYSGALERNFKVLVADASDDPNCRMHLELDAACRMSDVQVDFLLLRNPSGNTLIVANKSAHADLRMFTACLRKKEAGRRGKQIDPADLLMEGTIPGHEHWHVHEDMGFCRIYNGTETRPDIEQSALSFQEIVEVFSQCMMLEEARESRTRSTAA